MKQLTLPKKVKVGDNWYSIEVAEAMRERMYMGEVHYGKRTITLARRSYHGIPLKLSALHETFWHELTHAILENMGRKDLNNDEDFVEGFSMRLAKAIQSARF
ncbi:MAG: hypothetical protein ACKO0Z_15610 [Betaproteobacteria bacterium]